MEKELKKIIEYAKKRYGSFKAPSYSFVTFWLPDQCRLYKSLCEHYDLTEDSDFNCDICMHYYLTKNNNSWEVCTSLVGPYAMVSKKLNKDNWCILHDIDQCLEEDQNLLKIIQKHDFVILSESMLRKEITGFKIEDDDCNLKERAYVYEVLFFRSPLHLIVDSCNMKH